MTKKQDQCAGYIGDLSQQLAQMARVNGLDQLAGLLEVVALEAEAERKNGHSFRRQ